SAAIQSAATGSFVTPRRAKPGRRSTPWCPRLRAGQTPDAETLILKAIDQKRDKGGAAYAAGKTLIVFLDAGAGTWFPNRVARRLPDPLHFAAVWVVPCKGLKQASMFTA